MRRAAAGVAVELGEDDAVEVQPIVERRRGVDRVLADHRVDHQEDVRRLDALVDLRQLLHQGLVDRQPTGGIEDDHVPPVLLRVLHRQRANLGRRLVRLGEYRDPELLAQDLELMDGGGAVDVGRDQERLLLVLLLQVARELPHRGGLARALQPHHHDAGGTLLGPAEVGVDRPHHPGELVLADLDERLLRRDLDRPVVLAAGAELDLLAERRLLDPLEQGLGDAEVHVGLEQAHAHVAQRLVDDVLGQLGDAGQALFGRAKPARDGFQHGAFL